MAWLLPNTWRARWLRGWAGSGHTGTPAGVALMWGWGSVTWGTSETSGDPRRCGPACAPVPVPSPAAHVPPHAKGALWSACDWARPPRSLEAPLHPEPALLFHGTISSSWTGAWRSQQTVVENWRDKNYLLFFPTTLYFNVPEYASNKELLSLQVAPTNDKTALDHVTNCANADKAKTKKNLNVREREKRKIKYEDRMTQWINSCWWWLEKRNTFIQPYFWQNLVLVLKIGSHFQLQRPQWEVREKLQHQSQVRKCWSSFSPSLWSPIIIKIVRLTMKDDHPVTKLTSGPCLMGSLIAFSSRQTRWRAMSQVCVFGFFSQTDGFDSTSTWDSDGLHSLQGQRSAPPNTNCMCGVIHPEVAKFFRYLNWFLLKRSWNNRHLNNYPSSSMCRNYHANIWLKIERKDLYLQVKTAPLALFVRYSEIVQRWAFHRVQPPALCLHGSVHVNFIPSLAVDYVPWCQMPSKESSNVLFGGSVFPLCVVVIVLSWSSLPLLLSCRLFPGELVTHC